MITAFSNISDPTTANDRFRDAIIADLRELFEDSMDNSEFLGFDNTPVTTFTTNNYPINTNANPLPREAIIADLREIFEDSIDSGEFLGFENTPENRNDSLRLLFDSDGESREEFMGF